MQVVIFVTNTRAYRSLVNAQKYFTVQLQNREQGITLWRHETQHNHIQHNGIIWDIQYNDIRHNDTLNNDTLPLRGMPLC